MIYMYVTFSIYYMYAYLLIIHVFTEFYTEPVVDWKYMYCITQLLFACVVNNHKII